MTHFTTSFDAARGVLACRLTPAFTDDDMEPLIAAMATATAEARRHGPLRFLWDNRIGKVFPDGAVQSLWQIMARDADPADRIAILVGNSLAKVQARAKMRDQGETFASENAAYVWLSVGAAKAPLARAG